MTTTLETESRVRLEQLTPLAHRAAQRWFGKNGVTQEDLTQEITLALWQTLQERPDAPLIVLEKVAYHAAIATLRRGSSVDRPLDRKRRRTWDVVSLEVLQEDEEGWQAMEGSLIRWRRYGELPAPTEELALARVLYQDLWKQLTPRQRDVLVLRLMGCSQQEVACILILGRSWVHRIIEAIRRKARILWDDGVEPASDPKFATTTEAARELGLSRRSTTRLCREGKISGARRVERSDRRGMQWLIPRPVQRIDASLSASETVQDHSGARAEAHLS